MLILYVVCMLFYAIGGFLFVSIFVFKQPNVADAFSGLTSRRGTNYLVSFNSFSISSILGMVPLT